MKRFFTYAVFALFSCMVFVAGVHADATPQTPPTPAADTFPGVPFWLAADITPGSPLDVSFLLHRPAGKRGTVRADGERLVYGDGTPAAFWGVNLCWDALYPRERDGALVARRLAMSGANIVRLTYLDGGIHGLFRQDLPDTHTLDENRIARLDGLYAHLKENGVYSLVVLGMGRNFLKPGDGLPAAQNAEEAVAAYAWGRFFDERVQAADQRVWRTLLTRINPRTGLRWADDPAVAGIEILNESSLFYRYDQAAKLPAWLQTRIAIRWNRWLGARYNGSHAALVAAWGAGNVRTGEDLGRGNITVDFSFLDTGASGATSAPAARGADWNRFIAETCRDYYAHQIRFLRGLGVRQPISCNGGGSFSAADKWSNRVGDLFDQHGYHDHPNFSPNLTYGNHSALQTGMNMAQTLMRGRLAGRPYGVSEFDFCYPNDFRAEGWVPLAAYARFQGWSLGTAFAYWSGSWDDRAAMYGPTARISGVWRFHNDPASFGQWPLTALIFLRGDVLPARETVDIGFSDADTFLPEAGRFPLDPLHFLDDVAFIHRTRQAYSADRYTGKAEYVTPSGRVAGSGDYRSAKRSVLTTADAAGALLPLDKDGWRMSDTGELRYRQKPGVFVLDTPRTQGVVGFTGGETYQTGDLEITLQNAFGSVVVASLDGRPLRASRRILVTAIGRCRNTGFVLQPAQPSSGVSAAKPRYQATGESLGKAPILIEPIRFTLAFRSSGGASLKAFALNGSGDRIAVLPSRTQNGSATLTATGDAPATMYYEVTR